MKKKIVADDKIFISLVSLSLDQYRHKLVGEVVLTTQNFVLKHYIKRVYSFL